MSNLKWPSQSPQHLSICWGCTNGDTNICTCDRKLRPAGMPCGVLPSHPQVFFLKILSSAWMIWRFQVPTNIQLEKKLEKKTGNKAEKKEKKTTWADIGTHKWQFQIGYLQVQLVGDLRMGMVRWKFFGFDCTRKTWAWWGSSCNALLESMITFLSKTSHYTFRITCTSYNIYIYIYIHNVWNKAHHSINLTSTISFTNDFRIFSLLVSPRFRSHGIEAEPGAKLRVCGMDNVNDTFPISIGRVRVLFSFFFSDYCIQICIEGHDFLLKTRYCLPVDGWKKSRKDVCGSGGYIAAATRTTFPRGSRGDEFLVIWRCNTYFFYSFKFIIHIGKKTIENIHI